MTTASGKRCEMRKRGEYAPLLKRGRPSKQTIVIDYDAAPPDPPCRLRPLQRVTRWNVVTGQIEERWE